jgi:moderate conductance mechanosensitive channel
LDAQAVTMALPPVVMVILYGLLALLVSVFAHWIARGLLFFHQLLPGQRAMTPDRRRTLEGLFGSLISMLAFIGAGLAALALFLSPQTLFWMVGLFSAAFGLAARGLVADILAGSRFLFRNTFAIGEKVELIAGMTAVEGTVEEVNITNTLIRSPNGELYVVPNGDIGVIRNFSRAPFSTTRIRFCVRSGRLAETLDVLGRLGQEALGLLPDLTEPWQVISTSEAMGAKSEITVLAHTSFAKAATLRLQIFRLIDQRLTEAGIELLD